MGRARSRMYPVRGDGGAVLRTCSAEDGDRMEQLGAWRRDYDRATGRLRGYRVAGTDLDRGDEDMRSARLAVGIDAAQMQLNCERSRTRGLSAVRRSEREVNGLPAEDLVERVQMKVLAWPQVGAAKGAVLLLSLG